MKIFPLFAATALTVTPVLAEETRQLDAHEHGVGQLNIAFDGQQIAMELHAPGADIVGFEYAAESAQDRATVDAAVATLANPLKLFALTDAAGCSVVQAAAGLESEEDHDEHEGAHGEEHADKEHAHEDHAEEKHTDEAHEDHAHEDHAEEKHADDDHGEEKHTDEAHEDHAHEDHAHEDHVNEAGHTEFHAEYLLTCADPSAITDINFAYFDNFPNALEVEVQIITATGATSFEVERDAPVLDLRGTF